MPSKFHKVQKRVNKKKGNTTALHENSRDALRLRSAVARDDKVTRMGALREKINEPHMYRVIFFQDLLPDLPVPFTEPQLHEAVQAYLSRDDEALAHLRAERRPGRPASAKQTQLEQQQALEHKEYESGIWVPDMRDQDTINKLKMWKGHWVGLAQLTFVRVEKAGTIKESAFPPKGAA